MSASSRRWILRGGSRSAIFRSRNWCCPTRFMAFYATRLGSKRMRLRRISSPVPWGLCRSSPLPDAFAAFSERVGRCLPARARICRFGVAEALQLNDARQQRLALLGETRGVQLAQSLFAAFLGGAVLAPTAVFRA